MSIIAWIILGAIAGYLAGFLVKGDEGLGVIGHIVLGIVGALVGGFLAKRIGLPTIVGYIVAGVLLGPFTPGLSADVDIAIELAEIGIILLMAIELMLLAVNINFVAFSRQFGDPAGQVFVFFILTVAAAESAIGLAILVVLFRNLQTIDVEDLDSLKG